MLRTEDGRQRERLVGCLLYVPRPGMKLTTFGYVWDIAPAP